MTPLATAIGRYPHTAALFDDPGLDIQAFPVITRAFAPMVRENRFALSEMAIATFLQARAHGSDLVLLPVTLTARFQNGAMLRRVADPFGPGDLAGRRVGVRAYSQTTGMWLRGILQEEHGIRPEQIAWTTFEDAHVAAAQDPAWATRASPGSDMVAMLKDGTLDAAVFGNDLPDDPALTTVWPDPAAAGQAFLHRHGLIPVNHMLVARPDVPPARLQTLFDHFAANQQPDRPLGMQALTPAVMLAGRYCLEQGMLPRAVTVDEIWAGVPKTMM